MPDRQYLDWEVLLFRNTFCAVLLLAQYGWSAHALDYDNKSFQFSIHAPGNRTVEHAKPPNPDHGFKITISRDVYVWVDASYSDNTELSAVLADKRADWAAKCPDVRDSKSKMGDLDAYILEQSCAETLDESDPGSRIRALSLALISRRSPILYSIGAEMGTNAAENKKAIALFKNLVAGFRVDR